MTTLILKPVSQCFTPEYALLSLTRVCSRFGEVMQADFIDDSSVAVSFATCEAAQAAFILLNGYCLFGDLLAATFSSSRCFSVKDPTRKLLIENMTLLSAKTIMRKVKGVSFGPVVKGNKLLVVFDSEGAASRVAALLHRRNSRPGVQITVEFSAEQQ